jgi:hypothetical protein
LVRSNKELHSWLGMQEGHASSRVRAQLHLVQVDEQLHTEVGVQTDPKNNAPTASCPITNRQELWQALYLVCCGNEVHSTLGLRITHWHPCLLGGPCFLCQQASLHPSLGLLS